MDNLIFSLNATIPVFLVIVIGYILKRIGMLSEAFVKDANKFNFNVTLPCLLVYDLMNCGIKENFEAKYVGYCAITTLICILVTWAIAKYVLKDKSLVGEFVQGSYRGSAAILGIALIQNIQGDSGMGPLMIVGSVPLYNAFAVIILTLESPNKEKGVSFGATLKKAIVGVFKNPMIISILLGVLLSYFDVKLPVIADKTISTLAKVTTPLALVSIGAAFEGAKAIKMFKPTIVASTIKLVVQPLIFLPIAVALGFGSGELIALVIMYGAPTTASCFIMSKNMGHEGTLSSSIIVLTTLLSAFTVTACIYILKQIGCI
jgi:predicted permease